MKKIKIKRQEYPCRVTMGAMVRFKRESGMDLREVNWADVDLMLMFVWCCVKSACAADGVAMDLDLEAFADALTPEDVEVFNVADDAGKKKVTKEKA